MTDQKLIGKDRVSKIDFCEHSVLGKQHRLKFKTGEHHSRDILEYAHADLWGPESTPTHEGNTYFLSRKVWVYLLKNKSDAFDRFRQWKTLE